MGYYADFLDNAEYGAADINARLSKYLVAGVEDPFKDGTPYNTTIINEITVPISASGVVPEANTSCKVTINTTAKTITIAQGTCFFENGTMIEFDVAGSTLDYTAGTKHYVYVKSDLTTNTIAPYCSTTEPTTGDFIILAEISTGEVLTDTRKYARGKLPGYQSNVNSVIELTIDDLEFAVGGGTPQTLYLPDYSILFILGNSGTDNKDGFTQYTISDGTFLCRQANQTNGYTTLKIFISATGTNAGAWITITDNNNGEFEVKGYISTGYSATQSFTIWGL